jgi:hypothetical protein
MVDAGAFSDPHEFEPAGADNTITVRFEDKFVERVDVLADSLARTLAVPDRRQARQVAVATAVSVLSGYAGQRLYVERHGRFVEIEGLWR